MYRVSRRAAEQVGGPLPLHDVPPRARRGVRDVGRHGGTKDARRRSEEPASLVQVVARSRARFLLALRKHALLPIGEVARRAPHRARQLRGRRRSCTAGPRVLRHARRLADDRRRAAEETSAVSDPMKAVTCMPEAAAPSWARADRERAALEEPWVAARS